MSLSILSITSKSSFDRSPVPSCRWYNRSEFKSISIALPAILNSVFRCSSISHPTSGVTAAVVQPNSRFASTKSMTREKLSRWSWEIVYFKNKILLQIWLSRSTYLQRESHPHTWQWAKLEANKCHHTEYHFHQMMMKRGDVTSWYTV